MGSMSQSSFFLSVGLTTLHPYLEYRQVGGGLEKVSSMNRVFVSVAEMSKDQILTTTSIVMLLFTALLSWNVYSWLILVAIIFVLMAWYFKGKQAEHQRP